MYLLCIIDSLFWVRFTNRIDSVNTLGIVSYSSSFLEAENAIKFEDN